MPPQTYRHYKGGLYCVLVPSATDATNAHASENRQVVVYRSVLDGTVYVRDWNEFHALVASDTPRFARVKE